MNCEKLKIFKNKVEVYFLIKILYSKNNSKFHLEDLMEIKKIYSIKYYDSTKFNISTFSCWNRNRRRLQKLHTKLETVAAAMEHGMIWQHEDGTIVEILPGQCRGMTEVVDLLVFGFPFGFCFLVFSKN